MTLVGDCDILVRDSSRLTLKFLNFVYSLSYSNIFLRKQYLQYLPEKPKLVPFIRPDFAPFHPAGLLIFSHRQLANLYFGSGTRLLFRGKSRRLRGSCPRERRARGGREGCTQMWMSVRAAPSIYSGSRRRAGYAPCVRGITRPSVCCDMLRFAGEGEVKRKELG